MAKKNNVRKDIKESTEALKSVMQENLSAIATNMVDQIMGKYRNLTESQRFNAVNDIQPKGINDYKDAMLNALSVIAADALKKVRKEVPKKQNVRLAEFAEFESVQFSEFDKLPPDIQKRIKAMLKGIVGTNIADLEKALYFQYTSSVDSTDSEKQLQADLDEAAAEFVTGASITSGAAAASSQTVNEVRLAFFTDDEVSQEIEAFEFVNGDPVAPICVDLAGTVFSKDDPNLNRYWPPLHFNCKSWISPILVGNLGNKKIEDFKPSNKKLEDSIQFSEYTEDFVFSEIARPREGHKRSSKELTGSAE